MLDDIISELKDALENKAPPKSKVEKKVQREKKKHLKEFEEHRDKLSEYDRHLKILENRNSYSKTDPDTTFIGIEEDAINNVQTKPGIQSSDCNKKPIYHRLRIVSQSYR